MTSTFINIILLCGQEGRKRKNIHSVNKILNYTTENMAEVKLESAGYDPEVQKTDSKSKLQKIQLFNTTLLMGML